MKLASDIAKNVKVVNVNPNEERGTHAEKCNENLMDANIYIYILICNLR